VDTKTVQGPSLNDMQRQFQEWLERDWEKNWSQRLDLKPIESLLEALEECKEPLPKVCCERLGFRETFGDAIRYIRHCERKEVDFEEADLPDIVRIVERAAMRSDSDCGEDRLFWVIDDFSRSQDIEGLQMAAWTVVNRIEGINEIRYLIEDNRELSGVLQCFHNAYNQICRNLGHRVVCEKFADRLERQERKWALIYAGDVDGLLNEGFMDEEELEFWGDVIVGLAQSWKEIKGTKRPEMSDEEAFLADLAQMEG